MSRERQYLIWLLLWCVLLLLAILEVKFPVGGIGLYIAAIGFLGVTVVPLLVFIVIGHLNMADAERRRQK
jgi:hypothetical protein